jgi:hypothetical protein
MPKLYNHAGITELEFINLYKKARAGQGQRGAVGPPGPAGADGADGVISTLKVLRKYFITPRFTANHDESLWAANFSWAEDGLSRNYLAWEGNSTTIRNRYLTKPFILLQDGHYGEPYIGGAEVPLLITNNPIIIYKCFFHLISRFTNEYPVLTTNYGTEGFLDGGIVIYAVDATEPNVLQVGTAPFLSTRNIKGPIAYSGPLSMCQAPGPPYGAQSWEANYYNAGECLFPRELDIGVTYPTNDPQSWLKEFFHTEVRPGNISNAAWSCNRYKELYDTEYGVGKFDNDAGPNSSEYFGYAYGGPLIYPNGAIIITDKYVEMDDYGETKPVGGTPPFYGGCLAFTMFYEEFT